MPGRREEIEQRVHALVADFLDSTEEHEPNGFDIGVVAIVAEVRGRSSVEQIEGLVEQRSRRPEAGYTPEAEVDSYVAFGCSDSRGWIKGGLLRAALQLLDEPDYGDDEDDD